MIQRYKKKAITRMVTGGLIILLTFIIGAVLMEQNLQDLGGFFLITGNLVGGIVFLFGCTDLLKAKGYESQMILAFLIPGLCCSLIFVLFAPFIIIFCLKDKTR